MLGVPSFCGFGFWRVAIFQLSVSPKPSVCRGLLKDHIHPHLNKHIMNIHVSMSI